MLPPRLPDVHICNKVTQVYGEVTSYKPAAEGAPLFSYAKAAFLHRSELEATDIG